MSSFDEGWLIRWLRKREITDDLKSLKLFSTKFDRYRIYWLVCLPKRFTLIFSRGPYWWYPFLKSSLFYFWPSYILCSVSFWKNGIQWHLSEYIESFWNLLSFCLWIFSIKWWGIHPFHSYFIISGNIVCKRKKNILACLYKD